MEVQQFALNADNPTFSEHSLTWESSTFLCAFLLGVEAK
jgi:hypothetical protein